MIRLSYISFSQTTERRREACCFRSHKINIDAPKRETNFSSTPNMTDHSLFLKNLWYLAFHGSTLKRGKLIGKDMVGEKIVFGRDEHGKPFALRDNCPHRGVPLSQGWFKDNTIQCCYHGWQFNTNGTCKGIPALPPDNTIDVSKIKIFQYPCEEVNGTHVHAHSRRLEQ